MYVFPIAMLPINLHTNQNPCCDLGWGGGYFEKFERFFIFYFSYMTVNPDMCRPRKSATRQTGIYNGGANILEARHYIIQYTKVSDPNSSHARRKLHPLVVPPTARPLDHYYYQSPGHYGDGNISGIRLSHPLSLARSRSIIYLRPKTHHFVVFVVIIIVIPKLYGVRIT
jgi:hypothetical protein